MSMVFTDILYIPDLVMMCVAGNVYSTMLQLVDSHDMCVVCACGVCVHMCL